MADDGAISAIGLGGGADLVETETRLSAIIDFASTLMRESTVEGIVWALARRVVVRLGMQDCVVYLIDTDRGVLEQVAAHGPKNPSGQQILDPVELTVGEGIVGTVAYTGLAEIVPDTRLDPRYIVDDHERLSEIAVPIVANGRVLGVLNCEHTEPGFFDDRHLSLLEVAASMAAWRIMNAMQTEQLESTVAQLRETEARLSAYASDLERSKAMAEETSKLKSQFLANVSHELRTPVHGLIGLIDILRSTSAGKAESYWMDQMDASAAHLQALVEDVLDFSRLESGHWIPDLGEFSLVELVGSIVRAFEPAARQKGIELHLCAHDELPGFVFADGRALSQVLVNLVRNAVEFTDEGQVEVRVRAESTSADGGQMLELRVVDTGRGIPGELQGRIFEPFWQVDGSSTRRHGGLGLGLSVSARLVEGMGGRILLCSSPGEGSEFVVRLPVATALA